MGYMSQEGYDKLVAELHELETVERDLCKTYHPLNFHLYTLRRMNIFDQKMPLEVIFE